MNKQFTEKRNKTQLFQRCLAFIISGTMAVPPLIFENFYIQQNTVHAASDSISYGDVNTDGKLILLI